MTPKNTTDPVDDDSLGVLNDAASLDTAGIGILGGTAQVSVALPPQEDDDDLADDGVVDGEVVDLVLDQPVADEQTALGRINATEIVIEIPAAEAAEPITAELVIEAEMEDSAEDDLDAEDEVEVEGAADAALKEESALKSTQASPPDKDSQPAKAPNPAPEEESARMTSPPSQKASKPVAAKAAVEEPAREKASKPAVATVSAEAPTAARTFEPAVSVISEPAASALPEPAPAKRAAARPAPSVPEPVSGIAHAEKESPSVDTSKDKAVVSRPLTEPARTARGEVALTSKRFDDLGDASRETADLLTADRLLDPHQLAKPEPEGAWSHFLYAVSGRRINIGDGKRARARKELSARIAAPLSGGARFVPVLSRKGGVGKTAITALLGMALADAREDRVIAVDANPDRGTLADRIVRAHHGKSVRDLVRIRDEVKGYHDISAIVARDATRLDVLASDSDPRIAEAFSDGDYRDVAGVAAHYYSLVLTDTGTGIVHSVMSATLDLSDQIIIVSGLSVDEARLASETLTWLETNGYAEQARDAIVVLNQSTPGAPLVRLNELEAHFATRARHVVRVPYDAQIAGGGAIVFANLQPETRQAARELAALLVEGLRAKAA